MISAQKAACSEVLAISRSRGGDEMQWLDRDETIE
jgi:hypothetical protein